MAGGTEAMGCRAIRMRCQGRGARTVHSHRICDAASREPAEAQRRGVYEFDIPFSRQQLADYLGVERSGLSVELGKMRDEGLLDFHKSHFLLKTPETDRPFPSAR